MSDWSDSGQVKCPIGQTLDMLNVIRVKLLACRKLNVSNALDMCNTHFVCLCLFEGYIDNEIK